MRHQRSTGQIGVDLVLADRLMRGAAMQARAGERTKAMRGAGRGGRCMRRGRAKGCGGVHGRFPLAVSKSAAARFNVIGDHLSRDTAQSNPIWQCAGQLSTMRCSIAALRQTDYFLPQFGWIG